MVVLEKESSKGWSFERTDLDVLVAVLQEYNSTSVRSRSTVNFLLTGSFSPALDNRTNIAVELDQMSLSVGRL